MNNKPHLYLKCSTKLPYYEWTICYFAIIETESVAIVVRWATPLSIFKIRSINYFFISLSPFAKTTKSTYNTRIALSEFCSPQLHQPDSILAKPVVGRPIRLSHPATFACHPLPETSWENSPRVSRWVWRPFWLWVQTGLCLSLFLSNPLSTTHNATVVCICCSIGSRPRSNYVW